MKVSILVHARLALLLLLLLALAPASWAAGIPEISTDSQFLVTPEILKTKTQDIEKATDLGEPTKKQLLELYRKSLGNLETTASHYAQAAKFVQAIETAPAETKKIREEMGRLGQQPNDKNADSSGDVPQQEIEQQLLKTKAQLTEIEAQVTAFIRQLAAQAERPVKASQRLAEIKKGEEELVAALKVPSPADESPQVTEARHWMQQTQLQALASETKMLNQELVSMPVLVELATVQREATSERLEQTRALVHRLEAKVNRKRQAEATKSVGLAEEAMRQVADSPAVLQKAAAANTTLGDKLQLVSAALERTSAEKETLDKESKKIEENFKNTKQKIELAGLSQALGLMLHERRRTLPDTRLLHKKKTHNEQEIAEAGLLQMQSAEERKELEDFDAYVAEHAVGSSPDELQQIEPELRKILTSRKDLLDKIITSNQTYLGVLSELELLYQNYITIVVSFDSFLAERLVWIRSMPVLRLKDFQSLSSEAAALLTPGLWLVTGKTLLIQIISSPILILVCMLTVFLMWCKSRMRARLKTAVHQAGNPATYRFALPLQAFGLTVLLALPGPLLLMTLGLQVHSLPEITGFTRVVAMGLIIFSYRFFLLRVFRILLLPEGLAAGFFLWPKATITLLRREAGLMMVTFLPAIFFTQIAFFVDFRAGGIHILGRLLFIVALSFLATFFYRILHPRTGVWHRFIKDHSDRLLARLYPFFFFVGMLLPLVLIGLVIAGYVFAVGAFIRCLINSLWLVIVLFVCHQMVERWLIQSSRRLFLRKALSRRAQEKADQVPVQLPVEKEFGLIEEPAEDLVELNAESRKLLDTVVALSAGGFLWLVWADVLPALRIFNEFTLWRYGAVVNGQATTVPVTLADAGLTILIGIITLTATRHFPSLLKIVLLQHLDISAGSRYTATTLSRYLIGGTGLMAIANILGFSWSQIQWLVAALGVGIGFGLQEIVANFISGIIILFERPIRVGDVVTIGTTDGVVTKIRIRATTIRDYDRKELLVPNKEFISGRLLNWSLSDPVIRLLIPVGIAYGSDVQTAMNLMLQAAENNTLVLDDPKPVVTFDSFGDNALLLTLRCFIGSVDNRVPAKSGLHQVIDQQFREAEISMAFPQRDVHLDTNKPLDIRVVQERGTTPETALPKGNNNQK